MKLDGKVCLVTGGTKGIGAATAIELARGGADVAIVGRHEDDEALNVKAAIEAAGRRCAIVVADVSKPEEAARCVRDTADALGGVDVLVHAAGGPAQGSLMEVAPETWYSAFDIHVHAAFHLSRAVVPFMREKGEGAIILVSSTAGIRGCANSIAYGVAKGAIVQFTRAMARELAADNIRVNCAAPGVVRTRFQDILTPEQVRNNIENRIPLHREGKPEDVAAVIAMLATNDYMTGESVVMDGGLTMRIA